MDLPDTRDHHLISIYCGSIKSHYFRVIIWIHRVHGYVNQSVNDTMPFNLSSEFIGATLLPYIQLNKHPNRAVTDTQTHKTITTKPLALAQRVRILTLTNIAQLSYELETTDKPYMSRPVFGEFLDKIGTA